MIKGKSSFCGWMCVVGMMSAASAASHAQGGAAFRGLGHLPAEQADNAAIGISGNGQVVVGYHTPPEGQLAFRWTLAGGMQSLGFILEGDIDSTARDASADGTYVVGDGAKLRGHDAFRWDAVNGMVSLGNLAGVVRFSSNSEAQACSDDGSVVVGTSDNVDRYGEAFRWIEASGMVGLGDLPGGIFLSRAFGVSGDGLTVVGQGSTDLGDEAFRWSGVGGMVGLGDFPGGLESSSAEDASFDGSVIVGWGTAPSDVNPEGYQSQAFIWTAGDGMVSLGDLPGGRFYSQALAVSAGGAVVVGQGTSGDAPETGGLEAFVWTEAGGGTGMRSVRSVLAGAGIDLTGWVLSSATGVSNDGRTVAGFGLHNGLGEAWVATLPARCPGDFNGSGAVSVQDIFDFLAAYFSNDPDADVNVSGSITVQDIFDFLAAYFTPCA